MTFDMKEIIQKCKLLISTIQEYKQFNQEIEKILSKPNGNQLKNSKANSNQENLKILKEKIFNVFSHYRKLVDESQSIINRALSYGFNPSQSLSSLSQNLFNINPSINIYDAFEFVLSNELKMEQQRSLMENHKSLSELRQMAEKERKIAENQKQKAYATIQQLRKSIAKEKENSNLIRQKLLDEKQKRRNIETELEHQKEINKSLNLLIQSETHK